MHSRFVHMTNGIDFSVVKNAISALEDFLQYFMMSKVDTQYLALKKTCSNCAGTFAPGKISPLSLSYLHVLIYITIQYNSK